MSRLFYSSLLTTAVLLARCGSVQRVNEAAGCATLQGQEASSYAAVLSNQQAEPSATRSFSAQAVGYSTPPYGLDSKMVDVTQSQAIGTVVASTLQSPSAATWASFVPSHSQRLSARLSIAIYRLSCSGMNLWRDSKSLSLQ
ncbi:hypothetical protein [Pseudomonas oryzihabitans]|uniref:hypothetical protein n=1 Tax=Pseudomonas oryzihabitans TaxID=47885 RepID=UPI001ABFC551|nr:hypothetical protein [Pseudomonas oryzihabitans]